MRWYVAASLACFAAGATLAAVEAGDAVGDAPLIPLVLKWLAFAGAATAVCCLLIALGCGAPGEPCSRRR